LVAPGEADEVLSTRDVVEDRGLFGDADRVLRRHHVAERADMHVLHLARPPGIEDAGVGSHLVAFRMQVVLDGRGAPDAHLVGRLDDVEPVEQDMLVEVGIAPDRPRAPAAFLPVGGKHRIEL
jgi:hypothetical protein